MTIPHIVIAGVALVIGVAIIAFIWTLTRPT